MHTSSSTVVPPIMLHLLFVRFAAGTFIPNKYNSNLLRSSDGASRPIYTCSPILGLLIRKFRWSKRDCGVVVRFLNYSVTRVLMLRLSGNSSSSSKRILRELIHCEQQSITKTSYSCCFLLLRWWRWTSSTNRCYVMTAAVYSVRFVPGTIAPRCPAMAIGLLLLQST